MAYVRSPQFREWVEAATAEHERATKGGDEMRLTAAIREQESKVKKVATALVEAGLS